MKTTCTLMDAHGAGHIKFCCIFLSLVWILIFWIFPASWRGPNIWYSGKGAQKGRRKKDTFCSEWTPVYFFGIKSKFCELNPTCWLWLPTAMCCKCPNKMRTLECWDQSNSHCNIVNTKLRPFLSLPRFSLNIFSLGIVEKMKKSFKLIF